MIRRRKDESKTTMDQLLHVRSSLIEFLSTAATLLVVVGTHIRIRLTAVPSKTFTGTFKGLRKKDKESQSDKKTLEGNKSATQTPDQVLAFKWGLG